MNSNNKNMARKALLLSMEKVLARSCYNGNIQNYGAWGVPEDEGRFFRFPLTLFNEDCPNQKSKSPDTGISLDSLKSSYYKFGANELHIVDALEFILASLENEYGLDIYKNVEHSFIPAGYKQLSAETVFEAQVTAGAVGAGWIFDNPATRDIYESPDGIKYAYIKGDLHPICSPALMNRIIDSCSDNENLWHRFQSPRLTDKHYYSFFEFGSKDDIKKVYSLMEGKS